MLILSHAFTDMMVHSVALRPSPEHEQPSTTDGTHVKALLSTLEASKRFFDTLLSFPAENYYLISFAEWMRLPGVMMTAAKLCIPSTAHTAVGWDVKAAQDLVGLELSLEVMCYRFQNQTTYDKTTQPHPDFWWAMRFVTDLTRTWYVRKINPEKDADGPSQPASSDKAVHNCIYQNRGALPTPPDGRAPDQFPDLANVDFGNMDMSLGTEMDGGNDPFAFMRSADFDMEQLFDMGSIWNDDAYHGMGFGDGGTSF